MDQIETDFKKGAVKYVKGDKFFRKAHQDAVLPLPPSPPSRCSYVAFLDPLFDSLGG